LSDADFLGETEIRFDWQRVTENEISKLGEFEQSSFISGNHGEYDITKGHFICIQPYEDALTA